MRWLWVVGGLGALCAVAYMSIDLVGDPVLDTSRLVAHLNSANVTIAYEGAVSVMYYCVDPRLKKQMVAGGIPGELVRIVQQKHKNTSEEQEAVLSAALVGLARLTHQDGEQQAAVIDSGMLDQVVSLVKSDRSNLQLAAVIVAAELVENNTEVASELGTPELLTRIVTVLQLGAAMNTDEAIRAASELLIGLMHSGRKTRTRIVEDTDAVHAWLQIADSWNSSVAVGSAIRGLDTVTQYETDLVGRIAQAGIVPVFVAQVRKVNNISMVEALTVMGRLARDPLGRPVLINSGAVSVCAQMWYKSVAQYEWRVLCGELLLKLARLDDFAQHAKKKTMAIAALSAMARSSGDPEAQSAGLDALRDLTTFKLAVADMAQLGVAGVLVEILAKNMSGIAPEALTWHLRSLRSVAMTLAMLAVEKAGRDAVVDAGALPALVQCMKDASGPGLAVQVRVSAAAALVPIGKDPLLRPRIVQAGALPPLAEMFRSSNKHEHDTAQLVLTQLAQQPEVAAKIEQLRVRLE